MDRLAGRVVSVAGGWDDGGGGAAAVAADYGGGDGVAPVACRRESLAVAPS